MTYTSGPARWEPRPGPGNPLPAKLGTTRTEHTAHSGISPPMAGSRSRCPARATAGTPGRLCPSRTGGQAVSMWGDMPGGNAEPDPAFEPPTADQLAQWARDDAPNADHYYQVPARDQAERDAYDDIERVDAELAEARERSYHFHGTHVSDVPPHDYQCDDGCPYETDADRDARYRP